MTDKPKDRQPLVTVEMVTELNAYDISELCDATEEAIEAGGGFGWLETSEVKAVDLVQRFEDCGVAAVIFTDISRDGALTGVNAEATGALAADVSVPVIASGGVSGLEDISACAALAHTGL